MWVWGKSMLIRLELYFYYCLGLPTGQDSATYWNKGTEVSSLSRDKGTMGQAKNLTKGRDGTQDKTGRAEKDILKQKTMF